MTLWDVADSGFLSAPLFLGFLGAQKCDLSKLLDSDAHPVTDSQLSCGIWGVMDILLKVDFPDIWMRCAIHAAQSGSLKIIRRETSSSVSASSSTRYLPIPRVVRIGQR
ncbi:hypothetical protein B0T10DRAFT_467449 [Thelonectria olida]|uniref:Uncharacterized protein n=1 Tax=Thelonectria olida TaxID=1576542 RepID=A0A9P8VQX0_9HYPO|nr:hypothetical protein B0T10DRAFT_467449 [Thelonectria olida]